MAGVGVPSPGTSSGASTSPAPGSASRPPLAATAMWRCRGQDHRDVTWVWLSEWASRTRQPRTGTMWRGYGFLERPLPDPRARGQASRPPGRLTGRIRLRGPGRCPVPGRAAAAV